MRWLDGITNSIDMSLSKLRESERQGSLACCSPWGHKESDATERQQRRDIKLIRHRLSQRPELIQKPPSWALSFLPQHLAPIGRGSEACGWRWVMDFSKDQMGAVR